MNLFDRQLGKNLLDSVPSLPGIYRIFDQHSQLIYIGKAKNLKRRLSQYRNVKRTKKHKKMRTIIKEAVKIQFEICQTELDAELLETQLIQSYRPKWNTAGAFYFLYPMIGMKWTDRAVFFCYTTLPQYFEDFDLHGAYRSREISKEAFFSLIDLLKYVGHPQPRKTGIENVPRYSYVYGFRQLPETWKNLWESFWKGESRDLLEELSLSLLENAGARENRVEIQKQLKQVVRFWNHEAVPLFKARQKTDYLAYPVKQLDRDLIFLRYRNTQRGHSSDHRSYQSESFESV